MYETNKNFYSFAWFPGWIDDAIKFWQYNTHSARVEEVIDTNVRSESVYSIDGVKHRKPVRGINIKYNR